MTETKTIPKIVILCAVCAATLMAGCLGGNDPVSTTNHARTTTVSAQPTPYEPSGLELQLGEQAGNQYTEVCVVDVLRTDSYSWEFYGQYEDIPAAQGKVFIVAFAGIRNIGLDRDFHGAMDFSMTDSYGRRYNAEVCLHTDAMELLQEMYRDQEMAGIVLFEVPEDATGLKIQYDFGSVLGRTKLVSWSI